MAPKVKPVKEADTAHGAVIYTDGGCRNGFGGFGMHGYTYSHLPPTKGSGCQTNYLTKDGYVRKVDVSSNGKVEKPVEVKPLSYINGIGSYTGTSTNNVAELSGAINGLEYAISNDLKRITIITDSEYVVKGSNSWLDIWKRNNWIKSDGNVVSNMDHWKILDGILNTLTAKGTEIDIRWVKGHCTSMGNQLADKLATIGVLNSKENNELIEINTVSADGYWSNSISKNPFITQKRIYFTTRPEGIVPGEYFLGDHGKDDDLLGKRTADGCFSYVKLKTPEPVIEIMRNKQINVATGLDVIIMGRLDKLFDPNTYKDIMCYGESTMYLPHRDKLDLNFVDAEPVTKELRPPRLAMRAVESVNMLKGILLAHLEGKDSKLVETDITDILYDKDAKGEYSLKANYVVGFTSLKTEVNYGIDALKCNIEICMGVDLPERNYLKRMEKSKPIVKIITWMESDKMFRYATVITTDEDVGIYCGVYSNMKYIT